MNKIKQTPEFLEAWNELDKLNEGYTRQQMIDELIIADRKLKLEQSLSN